MWGSWYNDPDAGNVRRPPRTAIDADKMRLLAELEATLPQRRSPVTASKLTAVKPSINQAGQPRCFDVGPFPDPESVAKAGDRLENRKLSYRQRKESEKRVTGYRVYINSFPTLAAAKRKSEALRRIGVRDRDIVKGTAKEYSISLGVYANEANATSRIKALAKKKITARQQPTFRSIDRYWLTVPAVPRAEQIVAQVGWGVPNIRTNLTSCP